MMLGTLAAIREFLQGKKTYFVAIIGILTATVAWSQGELTGLQFVEALYASVLAVCVRAGIVNATK